MADPYDQDDSFETAKIICEAMAEAGDTRWYIYDNLKEIDVFVRIGRLK